MATTADIRNGMCIEFNNGLYTIVEFLHVKPGKGAAFVRAKMKNLQTGSVVERTFNAGEKVPKAHVDRRRMQYLYEADGAYTFMDNETYDQYEIPVASVADELKFILENEEVKIQFFGTEVIGVQVPTTVVLTVTETQPSIKGATVTGSGKPATMETGLVVNVPDFIEVGQKLEINTETGAYLKRA